MMLQSWVLWLVMLLLSQCVASTTTIRSSIAKDGCLEKCGNVIVPYPFGIDDPNCAKNEAFLLDCNRTSTPASLFTGNMTVHKISLEDGTMTVGIHAAYACYDQHGLTDCYDQQINLDNVPWTFSYTRNKLTAIGYDTLAFIRDADGRLGSGCVSLCNDPINITLEGSCSGFGCCQISMPAGQLKTLNITLGSLYNHSFVWNLSRCDYAFLVDSTSFNISDIDLSHYPINIPSDIPVLPVVLEWVVGEHMCEANEGPSGYSCSLNAICSYSENGHGHRCSCKPGFKGNPYLSQGCQDVDECTDPSLNSCTEICTNMPGNYTCSCPSGYHGDGRKGGIGCVKSNQWVSPVLIGTGTSIGLLFLLLGIWWLSKVIQRRKSIKLKEKFFKHNGGLLLQQKLSSGEGSVEKTKIFTSTELEVATDQYNENRILGRGGQGTVYKGMLTDGRIVAVKKPKIANKGQCEQFINEVFILSQIDHRNIMKLLGCCLETEVPLLVYEFIPNGTLSHLIRDQSEEFPISWKVRLRIATEVANAISYLHSAASVPIYHRDIKSENILLDEKFRAKVSDFGTSRSVDIDQTHLTTQVKGTFGYLDPEYFHSHKFTEKSDVYSFGVVLVELLTGMKPISSIGSEEKISLVSYFISSMEENRLPDILDPRVAKEGGKEELMAVASLAKRCLSMEGRNRPSMKEVVMELEGSRMSQGYLPTPHKQVGLVVAEPTEHLEFGSILIGSHMDDSIITCTSDVQLLMINTI